MAGLPVLPLAPFADLWIIGLFQPLIIVHDLDAVIVIRDRVPGGLDAAPTAHPGQSEKRDQEANTIPPRRGPNLQMHNFSDSGAKLSKRLADDSFKPRS